MASEAPSVAQAAADFIKKRAPGFTPRLGVILGSGMGGVGAAVEEPVAIPYSEIPDFPVSSVSGHAGKLLLGKLGGMSVACLQGRVHLYEGMDPATVRVYIYTLKLIGCEALFLTSAVGSLVVENGPGTIVCISDHINMQGRHPLIGKNDPIGTRFPDMKDAYDPELRAMLGECAKQHGIRMPEGVYLALTGPSFETPAEIRALKTLGADLVGMSVVPEVICARHCGLRVVGVGICVNLASGLGAGTITHEDTLHFTSKAADSMKLLMTSFIEKFGQRGQKRKAEALDSPPPSDQVLAEHATGLIDHTSLGLDDTGDGIRSLVDAAVAKPPHTGAHTAAVCIYPKFVRLVRTMQKECPFLYPRSLRVCTVVNFPSGQEPIEKVLEDTARAVADGADEVDLVIDYKLLKENYAKGREAAELLVRSVRANCPEGQVLLKVIIESGELGEAELIKRACEAAIAGGCDFVKTSTGKVKVNATPEAAKIMLGAIAANERTRGHGTGRVVGFKAAGGVRDVAQARVYLELAAEILLGDRKRVLEVDSRRLRFGASSLLPSLRKCAAGAAEAAPSAAGY
ncbi:unnamed protein product [Prorocentrum cordatum]|uniref:purine-nucleoside phosphorylase n=1 Tax=Prorocentrum cordatum TaxID=2364126 RepID=A0ABN9S5G7_9DINO|nr:unnamed protein product [Polarella glacialis]